jgi:hypothetical protein
LGNLWGPLLHRAQIRQQSCHRHRYAGVETWTARGGGDVQTLLALPPYHTTSIGTEYSRLKGPLTVITVNEHPVPLGQMLSQKL